MKPLADLLAEPEFFDFLLTCRRLEAANPNLPRISEGANVAENYVTFGQDPFFAFPSSTFNRAERKGKDRLNLFVRFLGLLGPQGALPLATTQEAYDYVWHNDDAFPRFLDLFNNRFIQLFYRAWGDSRPLVGRDRPNDDRFECYVGSPVGLGTPGLRGLDSVPDVIKVGFAGLMAPKAKSVSRLRGLISGIFGMKVQIDEFVGTRLVFEPDQFSRIGKSFANLGENILLGSGAYTVQDKIRIRLFAANLQEYRALLPSGKLAKKLADIVFFYVGAEVDWDIELALPVGEVEPVRLGKTGQLGWTTWMAPNWSAQKGALRMDARFDLAKRFGKS